MGHSAACVVLRLGFSLIAAVSEAKDNGVMQTALRGRALPARSNPQTELGQAPEKKGAESNGAC